MRAINVLPPRPVGPAAAELLAVLHARCFETGDGEVWDQSAFATLLGTPGIQAFLAVAQGEDPAGLVVVRVGGGESEILTIGILPAYRRRGQGLALIDAAARHAAMAGADTIFLEVAADNMAAEALYRRSGFRPIDRRIGYYRRRSGRSDAIIFRRKLDSRAGRQLPDQTGPN